MKSAIRRAICIHFRDTRKPYYKNGKVLRLPLRKECWTRGSPAREDATTIHGRLLLNRGDYSKQFPRLFSRPWDSSSSTPSALSSGVNQQKKKKKKKKLERIPLIAPTQHSNKISLSTVRLPHFCRQAGWPAGRRQIEPNWLDDAP